MIDVAIIGGGPAGTSTAIALARAGRSVAVFERSKYDAIRVGETLPPRARPLLDELGAAAQLLRDGHLSAPGVVTAWGHSQPHSNDFIVNPYGSGWHLDRARFDRMLAARARDAGAALYENIAVTHCKSNDDHWQISWRNGTQNAAVTCRFVVDATGRRGTDIKSLAGPRAVHDVLIGTAAFTHRGAVDDRRTLIEATSRGWWYSSVLPNDLHVTVYMTDADMIDVRKARRLESFQREIRQAPLTRRRCQILGAVVHVAALPAMTTAHSLVHGKNWLLAGDAASTWDPLSGQGICKALESGIRAADAIDRALNGNDSGLNEYGRWSRTVFTEYLTTRSKYYLAELRWPDSPFWQRRHRAI